MEDMETRQGDAAQSWAGRLERVEVKKPAEIKAYDFSSPKKFTKDQLNSLTSLYEHFCRMISSYFTNVLRTMCEVGVAKIEEQRYTEFGNSLSDTALVGVIDFKPLDARYEESNLLLDMSTAFGYLLVERLMGGSEAPWVPARTYTEVELALLRYAMEHLSDYLREAWGSYLEVETALRSVETNGRLLQAYSPQDVVVSVTLSLEGEGFGGTIRICMLAENLEKLIHSFAQRYTRAVKHPDPQLEIQKKDLMMDYLKRSDLELCAILDQCEMNLGDILRIQVGDVITLNKRISDNICVTVEGVPWYHGRLGETDRKKAVKIVDVAEN
ncbi:FliM/FliN family flagellar motor switch protein [Butyricicoccus faecihominis]|uniref:flagellar motor switch protein FliM n=1 Tax=Butyricicoccaceae TaxID=3085642 RepID=UPI002479824B|nr:MULTISPECIES: FliM/FliN family flagellar motor switch protein [Butyricicoccaceae]MCQ5130660.1 FliM/FliN family flagellar motor switch protein [Butyricicoccus faecihominis]WNX84814.1 FliM/FliN family flagellar motor switch protein [Agathobaculum sp. NTUH-O15-33]